MTPHRSRMADKTLSSLVFLKCNTRFSCIQHVTLLCVYDYDNQLSWILFNLICIANGRPMYLYLQLSTCTCILGTCAISVKSFTGHLITLTFVLSHRKSVPVSHQHQRSCSETNFEAKISADVHIQQWLKMDHTPGAGNWITVITERSIWTHFDGLMTKLLPTFYDFSIRNFKLITLKVICFWNLKK